MVSTQSSALCPLGVQAETSAPASSRSCATEWLTDIAAYMSAVRPWLLLRSSDPFRAINGSAMPPMLGNKATQCSSPPVMSVVSPSWFARGIRNSTVSSQMASHSIQNCMSASRAVGKFDKISPSLPSEGALGPQYLVSSTDRTASSDSLMEALGSIWNRTWKWSLHTGQTVSKAFISSTLKSASGSVMACGAS